MLRISDISFASSDEYGSSTVVKLKDPCTTPIYSPMSVAKIYDLIWQTQLSNEGHANCLERTKTAEELGIAKGDFKRITNSDLAKCKELLRHSIIGNPNTERHEKVLRILDNAF